MCFLLLPSLYGPQERSLLYLGKLTGGNNLATAQQQRKQQPAMETCKEDVTSVLNLTYSGVLCYEEVKDDVVNNYSESRIPESISIGNNNNSALVCTENLSRSDRDEINAEDEPECNSVTGVGGITASDIENGREGLLVAVLDR